MYIRLASVGSFGRYVMYTGEEFQEGISLTYMDEVVKFKKVRWLRLLYMVLGSVVCLQFECADVTRYELIAYACQRALAAYWSWLVGYDNHRSQVVHQGSKHVCNGTTFC
jgi:hypothetical protein